jgi:hypothetical protein
MPGVLPRREGGDGSSAHSLDSGAEAVRGVSMNWMNAYVRGLLIFGYFLVATVIIPNLVVRLEAVGNASTIVQDVVVLTLWGGGLVVGLYLLRRFQARGII